MKRNLLLAMVLVALLAAAVAVALSTRGGGGRAAAGPSPSTPGATISAPDDGAPAGASTTTPTATTVTTGPAPAPATSTPAADPAADRWVPGVSSPWQWELGHPLDLTSTKDMGTGVKDGGGAAAPDPVLYDIDGFDNSAETVAALHAAGKHVVCYIETGAWEDYRPDAGQYPSSVLGSAMDGYPSERYVDIRSEAVVAIVKARVKMCADKGFDAVEPDIDDSYQEATGFPLTQADNVAFDTAIAEYAHSLGLSIALKNGYEPSFAAALEPVVDFVLTEQCFEQGNCASYAPFTKAGKAVLAVEYNIDREDFCTEAKQLGFNAVKHDVNLGGGRQPC
jgi:hypothetical protein